MPRLILHTGTHKTGTTSLQKAFHDNRKHLSRHSVLYPETGLSQKPQNWGHHELAYAMRNENSARLLWSALRKEADEAGLETVFVSSEELSLLPFALLPGVAPYRIMADCFDGYDVRILCYVRPQVDMVASLYNHHIKSVGETEDILPFLARIAPRLEYANYLNVAAVALGGEDAIWLRRYGKHWMKGDIVSDVAAVLDMPLWRGFGWRGHKMNPGLTAAGLAKMLDANRHHADDPDALAQERKRILATHRAAPYETHQPLSNEARATITALFRYKNTQIGRRYLHLDGDLFDPDVQPIADAHQAIAH